MSFRRQLLAALIAIGPAIVAAQQPFDVQINDVATDDTQRAAILQALQQHADGDIGDCSLIITYVQHLQGGRDSSYGAVCTVRVAGFPDQIYEMCDDWLVGKFTEIPVDNGAVPDRWAMARFIEQHCPPGG